MIEIIQPGFLTTVQDEGRNEYLAFGMPRAGTMDRYAARMSNLLCTNPLSAALLEMTISGGTYHFHADTRIAICGANADCLLNDSSCKQWAALDIKAGDCLQIGFATKGARIYLAVSGGIAVPVMMGSRSTYLSAGVGGYQGRALRAGDTLAIGEEMPGKRLPIKLPSRFVPEYTETICVRAMLGPQDDLFTREGVETLFSSVYTVTNESDRMGYRLIGPPIDHRDKPDIVSDGLGRGAIQVPGNKQPIIMMSDCGTTGGYAKIAAVISADMWKLAQAKPQDKIQFIHCNQEEAVTALREEQDRYLLVAEWVLNGSSGEVFHPRTSRKMNLWINNQKYAVEIEEVDV